MKSLKERYDAGQLPEEDLSPAEIKLLQSQADLKRIARWRKVVAAEDQEAAKRNARKKNNVWRWGMGLAAAASLLLLFYVNTPDPKEAFVDYPFSAQHIRGLQETEGNKRWEQAIESYQKQEYRQAMNLAQPLDQAFFKGMCLLYLNDANGANKQFDLAMKQENAPQELYYYKGIALKSAGKTDSAVWMFHEVLKSKKIRGEWRESAQKNLEMLGK